MSLSLLPVFATDFTTSGWHLAVIAMLFALIVLVVVGRWGPR